MDTANDELSKCLHKVLNVVGASEYNRKVYWEHAMQQEILSTFECHMYDKSPNKRSLYSVGSLCEGTTTMGLNSDADFLHCYEDIPVVENLNQQGLCYLMATDENTKPGYVRLQRVLNQCPITNDNYLLPDDILYQINQDLGPCLNNSEIFIERPTSRNGPAETLTGNGLTGSYQFDYVHALRCQHIPRLANSWLHRTRKYEWPSQNQLKAMGSYGCFFVGVGHLHSVNKSIEWRISFTLQERDLMSSLNETQHKCYILLKMIKKDIIVPKAGESISSYHCKTILFYTIENSHRLLWTYGKLILCAQTCLKRLLDCVKAKDCPNFFIPKENMFDKLSPHTLKNVEYVLNDITDMGVTFLYTLNCDKVGELLKSRMCDFEQVGSLENANTIIEKNPPMCKVFTHNYEQDVYGVRTTLLVRMHMSAYIHTCTSYLTDTNQLLQYLQNTNEVTEHIQEDVRIALDSMIPHIKLQKQQCLFAKYLTDMSRKRSKTIPNVIPETNDCDLISSKLTLASLYIILEQQQHECEHILMACENSLEPYVISVCFCEPFMTPISRNAALAEKQQLTKMSSKDFRRDFTTGCIIFHPSQISLVHAALHYEMFRNVYTQRKSHQIEFTIYWLNWITVDSKIYLFFLQYLLYSKTDKCTETAVQNLCYVLNTDHNLGHRETGFNLLGWICLQEENRLHDAWRLLCISWKIRPFNNAAKWHMAVLLSRLINKK